MSTPNISEEFLRIEYELVSKLQGLNFEPPAKYVASPLQYAAEPHKEYVRNYCNGTKKVLFLDICPDKWGMAQTGIPFGDVQMVRDWLKISHTNVNQMPTLTSNNEEDQTVTDFSVTGFDCNKSDVSGAKFWSLIAENFDEPEQFFKNCFVYTYCPLLFLDRAEKNLTPENLTQRKQELETYCDESLSKIIKHLKIETVIAIGYYAGKRANVVKKVAGLKTVHVVNLKYPELIAEGHEE